MCKAAVVNVLMQYSPADGGHLSCNNVSNPPFCLFKYLLLLLSYTLPNFLLPGSDTSFFLLHFVLIYKEDQFLHGTQRVGKKSRSTKVQRALS